MKRLPSSRRQHRAKTEASYRQAMGEPGALRRRSRRVRWVGTGQAAPPHDDWTCIAAAGLEGRSPRVRETYSPEVKDYRGLDVVALNGAAIARRDIGACPGDGGR